MPAKENTKLFDKVRLGCKLQSNISAKIAIISLSEISSKACGDKLISLSNEIVGNLVIDSFALNEFELQFNWKADLVLLNLPDYSHEHLSTLKTLRRRGYSGVVLLLVQSVTVWAELIKDPAAPKKHIQLLEKPFSDNQLAGYVKRILTEEGARFRAYKRFDCHKTATVGDLQSIDQPCTLKNISKGGACIEFTAISNLNQNQLINLTVDDDDSAEKYNIWARVAWLDKEKQLAGLEFINTKN